MSGNAQERIAFFGGTFDPPHRGHLAVARAAADRFQLDRVLFAPVARQPLKPNGGTPILDRFAMVALATADDPRFVASDLDVRDDGGPNFTVDALARLRAREPDAKLFSLVGADAFQSIARWRHPQRLLACCDWIVAARPGYTLSSLQSVLPVGTLSEALKEDHLGQGLLLLHKPLNTRVLLLAETQEDVSATEVRSKLQFGVGHDRWNTQDVPERVAEYIRKTGQYQSKSKTI